MSHMGQKTYLARYLQYVKMYVFHSKKNKRTKELNNKRTKIWQSKDKST